MLLALANLTKLEAVVFLKFPMGQHVKMLLLILLFFKKWRS